MFYIIVWLCIFIVVELIGFFIYVESTGFRVNDFTIETKKDIYKDFNFVLITDLHDTDLGNDNKNLLDKIDELNPDFVVLSGDMITSYMQPKYNSDITYSFLSRLAKNHKVYYGLGNHEQRYLSEPDKFPGKFADLEKFVKGLGINFLMNEHADIDEYNCSVYGINIPIEYYRRVVTKKLSTSYAMEVLGEPDTNRFNIMLAHNPDQFEVLSEWKADLVCSGHVHGGIIGVPGIGGLISPQLKLFPKYDWGLYEKNGVKMILSRGIGWHTIPIRIWNKAEIVNITIKSCR